MLQVSRALLFVSTESIHAVRTAHAQAPELMTLTKLVKILRFNMTIADKFLVPLLQDSSVGEFCSFFSRFFKTLFPHPPLTLLFFTHSPLIVLLPTPASRPSLFLQAEAILPLPDVPTVPARELCRAAIACLGISDLDWPDAPHSLAEIRHLVKTLLWPVASQVIQRTVPLIVPQLHGSQELHGLDGLQPETHCRQLVRACFGIELLERPSSNSSLAEMQVTPSSSSASATRQQQQYTASTPLGALLALLAVLETPFANRRHLSNLLGR